MPRKLETILAEAVELIKPPPGSVEMFHAQLKACIDAACRAHQMSTNMPTAGDMKDRATEYLRALRRTRKHADAVGAFHRSSDFLAALDREIIEVEAYTCLVVRRDGPQRNLTAAMAVVMAQSLIDPDPHRHPENRGKDWPAIDCPWRRPARLTYRGAWLRLASLIFEGATGAGGRDMMKYAREIKKRAPLPYVAKLIFQPPS